MDDSNVENRNLKIIISLGSGLSILVITLIVVLVKQYSNMQIRTSETVKNVDSQLVPMPNIAYAPIQATGKRLLMEKMYKGIKISAYRLGDEFSDDQNNSVFVVILNDVEYQFKIFSALGAAYSEDAVFEIVGDKLWVVNGQTNKIDTYGIYLSEHNGNITTIGGLSFEKSIDLPRYKLGTFYHLVCNQVKCDVWTAFHQEAGCQFELNLEDMKFSVPVCGGMGGDIVPEKL